MLHRHERRSKGRDQSFDLGEEVVVARLDLDPDFVERLRVQPGGAQLLEQAVPIGNARSLYVRVLGHLSGLPAATRTKTRILRADGRRDGA